MRILFGIYQLSYLLFWSTVDGLLIILAGLMVKFGLCKHETSTHQLFIHWGSKLATLTRRSFGKNLQIELPSLTPPPTLMTSNHQSWIDIFLLLTACQAHLPVMLFVMKKELLRIPIFGLASKLMGCPLLSRDGTRSDIALIKNCVQSNPHAVIIIFPEGTRFAEKKKNKFKYLLDPKPTGVQLVLKTQTNPKWLDCHIGYQFPLTFWSFLQGKSCHTRIEGQWVDHTQKDAIIKQWTTKDNWIGNLYGSTAFSRTA